MLSNDTLGPWRGFLNKRTSITVSYATFNIHGNQIMQTAQHQTPLPRWRTALPCTHNTGKYQINNGMAIHSQPTNEWQ